MKKIVFNLLKLLILALMVIPPERALAQEKGFLQGVGKMEVEKEASPTLVKEELKALAFRDVISKALAEMDLDGKLFWDQFEIKFDQYFNPIGKRFQETFPVGRGGDFPAALKQKKLQEKDRFYENFGLARVISSYAVKESGTDSQNTRLQFLTVDAKVDRQALHKVYFRLVGERKYRQVKYIFLSTDFDIQGGDWKQLGVKSKEEMSGAVAAHWKKWLDQKLGVTFGGTVLGQGDLETRLVDHLKSSADDLDRMFNEDFSLGTGEVPGSKSDVTLSAQEETAKNPEAKEEYYGPDLSKSLWLKMGVSIKKTRENPLLKRRQFSFAAEILLVDMATNSPLYFEEIKSPLHEYSFHNDHDLSSQVASFIYRLPLIHFSSLKDVMKGLPGQIHLKELTVENFGNYSHLNRLKEILSLKGTALMTKAKIHSYDLKEGRLSLVHEGNPQKFKEFLLNLENLSLGTGKVISFPDKENPFRMILQNGGGNGYGDPQKVRPSGTSGGEEENVYRSRPENFPAKMKGQEDQPKV